MSSAKKETNSPTIEHIRKGMTMESFIVFYLQQSVVRRVEAMPDIFLMVGVTSKKLESIHDILASQPPCLPPATHF